MEENNGLKRDPGNQVREVKLLGRAFRGVVLPSGPEGSTKTVIMYVAVAESSGNQRDKGILTPECVTLDELRGEIGKLKADLEWLYDSMAKARKSQQREPKELGP